METKYHPWKYPCRRAKKKDGNFSALFSFSLIPVDKCFPGIFVHDLVVEFRFSTLLIADILHLAKKRVLSALDHFKVFRSCIKIFRNLNGFPERDLHAGCVRYEILADCQLTRPVGAVIVRNSPRIVVIPVLVDLNSVVQVRQDIRLCRDLCVLRGIKTGIQNFLSLCLAFLNKYCNLSFPSSVNTYSMLFSFRCLTIRFTSLI